MFAQRSLLAYAFVGVCTAASWGPVGVAASVASTGGQGVADPADRSTLGHSTSGHDVKPAALRLDSIAPRERSPKGPGPAPRKRAKTPLVLQGAIEATSGIPVDVIRRILRQNFGRYRQCYEKGLKRHPKLQGEVRVRFAIELDGSTSNSRDDGSTLPDASVIRCMASAIEQLSFPKLIGPWAAPDGGPMGVLVHFWLSPE
jgi:hypothetical protein